MRVELISAGEQLLATRPALIDTGGVRVVLLARVRPLGARLPEYLELLRRQFLTPLLLTLVHLGPVVVVSSVHDGFNGPRPLRVRVS